MRIFKATFIFLFAMTNVVFIYPQSDTNSGELELAKEMSNIIEDGVPSSLGGFLLITNKRLVYYPTFGTEIVIIFSDISSLQKSKTLDVADNAITITLKDGKSFQFNFWDRDAVFNLIRRQIK